MDKKPIIDTRENHPATIEYDVDKVLYQLEYIFPIQYEFIKNSIGNIINHKICIFFLNLDRKIRFYKY